MTPIRTPPKVTSQSSSAGFTAFIITSARLTFTATSPNSIFGTATAQSWELMILNALNAPSKAQQASGSLIETLVGKRTRKPALNREQFRLFLHKILLHE